jgi:hypothetical protein
MLQSMLQGRGSGLPQTHPDRLTSRLGSPLEGEFAGRKKFLRSELRGRNFLRRSSEQGYEAA